jgi:hypothetical protein
LRLQVVVSLALTIAHGSPAERQAAEANLKECLGKTASALAKAAETGDDDGRRRLADAIRCSLSEWRIAEAQCRLSRLQAKKLAQFRLRHADLCSRAFSETVKDRLAAWDAIWLSPGEVAPLVDPLIIVGIQDPSMDVAAAAARAAGSMYPGSQEVVDALSRVLWEAKAADWYRSSVTREALGALWKLASPRSVPMLLSILQDGKNACTWRDIPIAEIIGAAGDKRAIPYLIPLLQSTKSDLAWMGEKETVTFARDASHISRASPVQATAEKETVTFAPSDAALYALLRLTGQDVRAYPFSWNRSGAGGFGAFGFAASGDREDAIARFMGWWDRHKDQPPYSGLEKLVIPRAPGDPKGP